MSDIFRVDLDVLRLLGSELGGIAGDTSAAVDSLRDAMSSVGDCWGKDDLGRSFAEHYQPDCERGMQMFELSAQNLREMSARIGTTVAGLHQVGNQAAQLIANSVENRGPTEDVGGPNRPLAPRPSAAPEVTGAAPGAPTPVSVSGASAPPSVREKPAPTGAAASQTARRPSASVPLADAHAASAAHSAAAPGNEHGVWVPAPVARSGLVGKRTGTTTRAHEPAGMQGPAGQSSTGSRPRTTSTVGPASVPPSGGVPRMPLVPQSKLGASTKNQPVKETDRRRGAGADKSRPAQLPSPWQLSKQPPWRSRTVDPGPIQTDTTAARLIQQLAARHGIELSGFENAYLAEPTVRDIAAAVDQTLDRHHAIDLRILALVDLPAARPIQMVWYRVAVEEGPAIYAARLDLDRSVFTGPEQLLVESIRTAAGAKPQALGCEERPVHSAIVRELGRALDHAGGLVARRKAPRPVVTEYLRLVGAELSGETVGLDPEEVVVEAFTEVEVNGDRASAPAKILHQLLTEAARDSE